MVCSKNRYIRREKFSDFTHLLQSFSYISSLEIYLESSRRMKSGQFICVMVICLVLLLDPFRTTGGSNGVQAIAVDKKKIMKALFLAKIALKKKKLLVMPMPVPILVEKKHKEHHHMTYDHHGGW